MNTKWRSYKGIHCLENKQVFIDTQYFNPLNPKSKHYKVWSRHQGFIGSDGFKKLKDAKTYAEREVTRLAI